jgi:branched-chain amino acid transport system substrate-binding protein
VAEWAFQRFPGKVAILTDTSSSTASRSATTSPTGGASWAGADSIAYQDTFKNDDKSFDSHVAGLRRADPDVIFISSCPPGGATITRAIRAAGIDTPIVAGICMDGDYWIESVPNLRDFFNIAEVSTYGDDPRGEVNELVGRLEGDANTTQPIYAVEGYSMMQAFQRAAERANSVATDAVRAELERFKEEPLLVGPTTFTPQLHASDQREYAVLEIKNGEHRFVEKFKAESVPPVE